MTSTSPFVAQLDTNYVPSSNEIVSIQALIQDRQKLLEGLDREIEALAKCREEHATFVKKHSALLSPIRRIPNDVLSLIFLISLPRTSPSQKRTQLSNGHPAVILSHVCQRWRRLSLDTALLWTVIDIEIPKLPDPREYMLYDEMSRWEGRLETINEITRAWISRSANCPLTISFLGGLSTETRSQVLGADSLSAANQRVSAIIDAICAVSNRWRSVYLSLDVEDDFSAVTRFFGVNHNDVPLLENLAVNVGFISPTFFTRPPSRFTPSELTSGAGLVKAASLRRLAIGRLWGTPFSLPINWAGLTEISFGALSHPPGADFPLSLLARCPNLIRCSVTWQSISPTSTLVIPTPDMGAIRPLQTTHEEILLPSLQVLEVRGSEPPPGVASRLHLPSLRQLILLCTSSNPPLGDNSGVVELVQKFGDRLTDVTLNSYCFAESTLMHTLESLPNVVNLRLVGSQYPPKRPRAANLDKVLDKLTPKSNDDSASAGSGAVRGSYLCPKLERFGCRMTHSVGFSEEALARFIASRRPTMRASQSEMVQTQKGLPPASFTTPTRLESVVLAFPSRKPNKAIRQRLQEMDVDLDGMILITAYQLLRGQTGSMSVEDESGSGLSDHDDYILTVGPFEHTLDGWALEQM